MGKAQQKRYRPQRTRIVTSLKRAPKRAPLRTCTNSLRGRFMCCRRRFQYEYVHGIAPLREPLPWIVGGALHDLLDRFYSSSGQFCGRDEASEVIDEKIDKAMASSVDDQDRMQELERQRAVVLGMFLGYVARWGKQDMETYDRTISEQVYASPPMPETGWQYTGKLDVLALKGEEVHLLEHKTVSALTPGYIARLPLDTQILGYVWLANLSLRYLRVKKIVYNCIRKSALRFRKADTQSSFTERIVDDYLESPESYFYRETLVVNDADVQRFVGELSWVVGEIQRCVDEGAFYQNTLFCDFMGTCPYLPLCINGEGREHLRRYRWKETTHEELTNGKGITSKGDAKGEAGGKREGRAADRT